MVVTDPPRGRTLIADWRIGRMSMPARPDIGSLLPLLITVGVLAGLAVMSALSPIAARGDYGQWLMTSRYYLGEGVPDYRTITALPPVVPLLIAGARSCRIPSRRSTSSPSASSWPWAVRSTPAGRSCSQADGSGRSAR